MARWRLALALAALAAASAARPAPPRCPPAAAPRCVPGRGDERLAEYNYSVDGMQLKIEYTDGQHFLLVCSQNLTLDNSAMPRFESPLRVSRAQLRDCPAPRDSYDAALQRLNVVVMHRLKLSGAGRLTPAQLGALGVVHELEVIGAELAPRTLAAPAGLRKLILDRVRLPPGELRLLPTSLELLQLIRVGANVTREVLERLPKLVKVTMRDSTNVSVTPAGAMSELAVEVMGVRVPSELTLALHTLTIVGWGDRRPAPWTSCGLHSLVLAGPATEELPARWVSGCTELRVLSVTEGTQLGGLHATSLRGARNLQELHLKSCALTALPEGLLDDAEQLRVLDLSSNHLKELPNGLFVRTHSLHTLILASNNLTKDVFPAVNAVKSLSVLDLSMNELGDSCDGHTEHARSSAEAEVDTIVTGASDLKDLEYLTELNLMKTNASLMCRDWRLHKPRLRTLNLSNNSYTELTFTDLQFRSAETVSVDLTGNAVRSLRYTQHDYQLATSGASRSSADFTLDYTLDCDCKTYWAARALQDERSAHMTLRGGCARSQGPRALRDVVLRDLALDSMVCAAPALCADAPGCACAWRHSGVEPPRVLRVECERAGVARLADVVAPVSAAARRERMKLDDYTWQLYLAHNRITDLSAADFPKHFSVLDLTNNSLSLLREEDVRALLANETRRVRLARNPLACNCSAADTLSAMRAHQAVLDYDALTCADGSALAAAHPPHCAARGLDAGVVAASAALVTLLAAAALAGLLWHPALRLRLKAALHQRGWLPAPADADDDDRRFDVFLSFSHGDERFVRDELVARLESGPAPYRLCVHYRDWVPGGWIPAQIAASVRASRRTVAVVSAHFLRSAWARAEFQEAYALALRDARPRLVVVLLDDPAALPLDDKLRSYLATNTYVRWGDPWFWQKLRLALPRSRGPARAPEVSPEPAATLGSSASWSASSSGVSTGASSGVSSGASSGVSSGVSPGCAGAEGALELARLVAPAGAAQAVPV